jgi:hypothetical protein
MSRDQWAEQIERWLSGTDDDLNELRELLLIDERYDEDNLEEDESCVTIDAEMQIEDLIGRLDATSLNLRRIQGWLREQYLPAGPERLLKKDFWKLMTDDEKSHVLAFARKNFCRTVVEQWEQRLEAV